MPQFAPGEVKTARAPLTVSPSGLSCEVELFLGPDDMTKVTTSGRIPFTSTGVSQNVRLPVAMPAEGTYHVFIDVYAEGIPIAAYKATEDVVIAGAAEFAYVSAIRQIKYESAPGWPFSQHKLKVEIDIKNTGSVAGLCRATPQMACAEGGWVWSGIGGSYMIEGVCNIPPVLEATLQPGEIVTFWGSVLDSPAYGYTCKVRFTGDPGTTPEEPMI